MHLSVDRLPKYFYSRKHKFQKGERHVSRVYNYTVIIFMLSGVLRFTENGKKTELKSGEYYIQQEGLEQIGNLPCDEPEYFFMEFNGNFNNKKGGIPIRGHFSIESFSELIDDLCEAEFSLTCTFYRKYSLFLRILDKLYQKTNHIKSDRLEYRIAEYIHENYKRDITILEIEKHFSYSSNHIINVFKSEFGFTPYQYIKKLRMDEARQLMISTTRSIEDIAFECGYSNFSTFFRNFTGAHGHSPSAWREQAKKFSK